VRNIQTKVVHYQIALRQFVPSTGDSA
jgi:hypothetical protein